MLQEAIEKNRGFLKVCVVAAVITGAAVLIYIVCMAAAVIVTLAREQDSLKAWQIRDLAMMGLSGVAVTLKAMMAFALADFIRWMLNRANQPAWILRRVDNGIYPCVVVQPGWILKRIDKCIYLCIGVRLLYSVFAIWTADTSGDACGQDNGRGILQIALFLAFQLLWIVPWVLIGIAAGKGVRLMEEYRRSGEVANGQRDDSEN